MVQMVKIIPCQIPTHLIKDSPTAKFPIFLTTEGDFLPPPSYCLGNLVKCGAIAHSAKETRQQKEQGG